MVFKGKSKTQECTCIQELQLNKTVWAPHKQVCST